MIKYNDVLRELVQIYKRDKLSGYFFEELASMQQTKPYIDLDRRRRAINVKNGVNIGRDMMVDVFSTFERLKLGKLIKKNIALGNTKFHWTCTEVSPVDLARDVLKVATVGEAAPQTTNVKTSTERVYIFKTEAGKLIELSPQDILNIKQISL